LGESELSCLFEACGEDDFFLLDLLLLEGDSSDLLFLLDSFLDRVWWEELLEDSLSFVVDLSPLLDRLGDFSLFGERPIVLSPLLELLGDRFLDFPEPELRLDRLRDLFREESSGPSDFNS